METTHTHSHDHTHHDHHHEHHEHHEHGSHGANEKNLVLAILSYLGPLVIVSYILAKDNAFVKYHIRQGLVLLTIEVFMWFLGMVFWFLFPIIGLINIAIFILSIVGIVNAVKHAEHPLPVVGKYASYFKI